MVYSRISKLVKLTLRLRLDVLEWERGKDTLLEDSGNAADAGTLQQPPSSRLVVEVAPLEAVLVVEDVRFIADFLGLADRDGTRRGGNDWARSVARSNAKRGSRLQSSSLSLRLPLPSASVDSEGQSSRTRGRLP